MDTLKNISEKIKLLESQDIPPGINAVLTHIETAEKYYARARLEKDMNLFTDVIYRTNHAFEGILKEAYIILEERETINKSPYQIEEYLSKNAVFKERVMELFTNYRTNWRNPSTHDYQLSFTEQEAFLAIVTVSAFVSILLDQVIERIAYKIEKERVDKKAREIRESISNFEKLPPIEKVSALLSQFSESLIPNKRTIKDRSEPQLYGMLIGFLESVEPNLKVNNEPVIRGNNQVLHLDLIVELGDEKILIELKRTNIHPDLDKKARDAAVYQVKYYLMTMDMRNGIIYYFPTSEGEITQTALTTGAYNSKGLNIREIFSVKDTYRGQV